MISKISTQGHNYALRVVADGSSLLAKGKWLRSSCQEQTPRIPVFPVWDSRKTDFSDLFYFIKQAYCKLWSPVYQG